MIEIKIILHTFLKKVKPRPNNNIEVLFVNGITYAPQDDRLVYLDII